MKVLVESVLSLAVVLAIQITPASSSFEQNKKSGKLFAQPYCPWGPDWLNENDVNTPDAFGNYSSCPSKIYNPILHADNVEEVEVDVTIVQDIYQEYLRDVKPHLHSGYSTDDFCLVTPYNPKTKTWETNDDRVRSDMKWYSVNNKATYDKYMAHIDRIGLKELVAGKWIDDSEGDVTAYSIFYLIRSHSEEPHFHVDWSHRAHTQILTFLIPLNQFDIHMLYKDNDGKTQDFEYKYGKAVGFGGGFRHSTGLGHGDEEDVLLCVYLGKSGDEDIWEYAQMDIVDELAHYMNPFRGFVANEWYGNKCNPKAPPIK